MAPETFLCIDATADSIIEIGKELFFPGGISSFGSIDTMEFTLANYKEDTVSNVVVGGSVLPFTLQRYLNATKLPRARLSWLAWLAWLAAMTRMARFLARMARSHGSHGSSLGSHGSHGSLVRTLVKL